MLCHRLALSPLPLARRVSNGSRRHADRARTDLAKLLQGRITTLPVGQCWMASSPLMEETQPFLLCASSSEHPDSVCGMMMVPSTSSTRVKAANKVTLSCPCSLRQGSTGPCVPSSMSSEDARLRPIRLRPIRLRPPGRTSFRVLRCVLGRFSKTLNLTMHGSKDYDGSNLLKITETLTESMES